MSKKSVDIFENLIGKSSFEAFKFIFSQVTGSGGAVAGYFYYYNRPIGTNAINSKRIAVLIPLKLFSKNCTEGWINKTRDYLSRKWKVENVNFGFGGRIYSKSEVLEINNSGKFIRKDPLGNLWIKAQDPQMLINKPPMHYFILLDIDKKLDLTVLKKLKKELGDRKAILIDTNRGHHLIFIQPNMSKKGNYLEFANNYIGLSLQLEAVGVPIDLRNVLHEVQRLDGVLRVTALHNLKPYISKIFNFS